MKMAPNVRNTIIALEANESTWIRIDESTGLFEKIKVENWVDASFTGFCIQSSQTVHCFTSTSRYSIHDKSTTHEVRMCHIWLMSLYSCSAKRNNKTNENPIVHCCSSRWIRAESSQQRNAGTFSCIFFYCKFDRNYWQRCCRRFSRIFSNWKQHNSLSYKMCKFRRLHSKYRRFSLKNENISFQIRTGRTLFGVDQSNGDRRISAHVFRSVHRGIQRSQLHQCDDCFHLFGIG